MFFQSAGTFEDMTGVTSSYQPDRPRGSSGSASSLKARFENIAKADEEVTSCPFSYFNML